MLRCNTRLPFSCSSGANSPRHALQRNMCMFFLRAPNRETGEFDFSRRRCKATCTRMRGMPRCLETPPHSVWCGPSALWLFSCRRCGLFGTPRGSVYMLRCNTGATSLLCGLGSRLAFKPLRGVRASGAAAGGQPASLSARATRCRDPRGDGLVHIIPQGPSAESGACGYPPADLRRAYPSTRCVATHAGPLLVALPRPWPS